MASSVFAPAVSEIAADLHEYSREEYTRGKGMSPEERAQHEIPEPDELELTDFIIPQVSSNKKLVSMFWVTPKIH